LSCASIPHTIVIERRLLRGCFPLRIISGSKDRRSFYIVTTASLRSSLIDASWDYRSRSARSPTFTCIPSRYTPSFLTPVVSCGALRHFFPHDFRFHPLWQVLRLQVGFRGLYVRFRYGSLPPTLRASTQPSPVLRCPIVFRPNDELAGLGFNQLIFQAPRGAPRKPEAQKNLKESIRIAFALGIIALFFRLIPARVLLDNMK